MVDQLTLDHASYIVRYNVPTKYDVCPFGTIIKVMGDGDSYHLFIQLSRDIENVQWERTGVFFEKIFNDKLNDPILLGDWLSLIP